MDDLPNLSLSDASEALRTRRVSSVELTKACLARIDRDQATSNCFISLEPDDALCAAAAADEELAKGRWRGPLHGVPLAHKDMFYREGRVSTFGSKICRDYVPQFTSTLIRRLESAGAIYLGSLNMSEFAASPTGHNEHFGHCRNPWNPEHITGGSSSGSGAAVASRMVFGSFGSDTGGSVRLPAGLCGVVGLKPTNGLISRYGGMPRCWSLDVFGPLARTVRDCAHLLQAAAGHDAQDPTTNRDTVPDYAKLLERPVRGLRVCVPTNHLFPEADDSVRAALLDSLDVFRSLGIEIVDVAIPDPRPLYELTNVVNKAEAAAVHEKWIRAQRHNYAEAVVNRIEAGFHIPAVRYIEALSLRSRLLTQFVAAVFDEADALFLPLLTMPVPTIAESELRLSGTAPAIIEKITRCTRWVNYLGLPAISIPCGFSDGLPIAFQLLARPFGEPTLFALGHEYQGVTAWHTRLPQGADLS